MRESAGARQDDLSSDARDMLGLPWSRSRIAAIERGAAPVHVEDLITLAALLSGVCEKPVGPADLLDVADEIALSPRSSIVGHHAAAVLRGDEDAGDRIQLAVPKVMSDEALVAVLASTDASMARVARGAGVALKASAGQLSTVKASMGEADARAQRTLGLVIGPYTFLCSVLWGQSLSAERDARIAADPTTQEASRASTSARRGRVTRQLLAEARAVLARADATEEGS